MAKYLVWNGYHLILIDKDETALQTGEEEIKRNLSEEVTYDLEIFKIHMAIFDEDKIQKLLATLEKWALIKYFINMKNVRLAKMNHKWFTEIGYKEVSQMSQENNHIVLCLLNIFLKSMVEHDKAAVINVVNSKNDDDDQLKTWDLMFYHTSRFNWEFINTINQTYPSIKTLNVITDFHELKDAGD